MYLNLSQMLVMKSIRLILMISLQTKVFKTLSRTNQFFGKHRCALTQQILEGV